MNLNDDIVSEDIKNNIKITTYADGSQHFEYIGKQEQTVNVDNRSILQKIKDWWNNSPITPYVKVRDLADPFDDRDDSDKGSDGKIATEIGIKVKF